MRISGINDNEIFQKLPKANYDKKKSFFWILILILSNLSTATFFQKETTPAPTIQTNLDKDPHLIKVSFPAKLYFPLSESQHEYKVSLFGPNKDMIIKEAFLFISNQSPKEEISSEWQTYTFYVQKSDLFNLVKVKNSEIDVFPFYKSNSNSRRNNSYEIQF